MAKRWTTINTLLIALLLLFGAGTAVAGNHEDRDRGEGDRGSDEARDVRVDTYTDRIVIELEKETDAAEEEVKFEFDANEGDLKLEFKREDSDAESEFEYKAELQEVVEYVDVNNDGAYDPENDTAVQTYAVDSDMTWTVGDVEDITTDGKTGKKVTATGTFDGADSGSMIVTFHAYGDFMELNATSLRPTDVKFDIGFEDFPFTLPTTRLALDVKLEVKSEHELDDDAEGTGLNATAEDVGGYFTWVPTALVDGNETDVVAHVYEDEASVDAGEAESEQKLTLSYTQGASILHDPTMGMTYVTASQDTGGGLSGLGGIPGPAAALVAVGALGAALLARRRG